MLPIWSLHIIGGNWMAQGSWVGDPLLVSFLLFSSIYLLLFIPYECISCPGMGLGVSPSVPWSLSFSSHFSLLGVDACWPSIGWSRLSYWTFLLLVHPRDKVYPGKGFGFPFPFHLLFTLSFATFCSPFNIIMIICVNPFSQILSLH